MHFPRGKSILRLVATGFFVVAAPLVAAIVLAVLQVGQLAEQSRRAVLTAETATQQSRALVEQLTAMERSLGQFLVLGDAQLYDTYVERRKAFLSAAGSLARLDLGDAVHHHLRELYAGEAALNRRLARRGEEPAQVAELTSAFAGLAAHAAAITAESRNLVAREANQTRDEAARLQRQVVMFAAAAIPAAAVLALVAILLIIRPLAAIKRAIAKLGGGDFRSPVTVRGPRDLEDLGSQLDWLRRRTVALETEKLEFLRQVSHDLKTPLSSIREGAELLEDGGAKPANVRERIEIVRIIRESSLRLQDLIEHLLQFQRAPALEAGNAAAGGKPVRLAEVLDQVIDKHRLTVRAKALRVGTQVPEVMVRADPLQLATVLDNILSNAVKYSPQGGAVRVTARSEGGCAILEVEDDGPGVAHEERERVFDPFYRGRTRASARVGGTGLGLAIVKRLVEANGGTVEFLDSPCGARVRATLPAAGHG